ncbi:MAG: hemolysin III family protein [Pseudomonadota bacterium]
MSIADLLVADEGELAEHYPNRVEHAADGAVHAVGILFALVGGGVLVSAALMHGGYTLGAAISMYAASLLAMLSFSAVYNLTRPSPARRLLRRLDEAGIFLLIAGSYTPLTMKLLPAEFAVAVTVVMWLMAFAGAAGKVFAPQISDRMWCIIYLAFGWLSAPLVAPGLTHFSPLGLGMLAACGVLYSAGVLIYLNHKLPFRRAAWHGLVVLAAGLHYGAVFLLIAPGS